MQILAAEKDRARIWPEVAGNQVENRGLARAVGADQADHSALFHGKTHPVNGQQSTKTLADALESEEAHGVFSARAVSRQNIARAS